MSGKLIIKETNKEEREGNVPSVDIFFFLSLTYIENS